MRPLEASGVRRRARLIARGNLRDASRAHRRAAVDVPSLVVPIHRRQLALGARGAHQRGGVLGACGVASGAGRGHLGDTHRLHAQHFIHLRRRRCVHIHRVHVHVLRRPLATRLLSVGPRHRNVPVLGGERPWSDPEGRDGHVLGPAHRRFHYRVEHSAVPLRLARRRLGLAKREGVIGVQHGLHHNLPRACNRREDPDHLNPEVHLHRRRCVGVLWVHRGRRPIALLLLYQQVVYHSVALGAVIHVQPRVRPGQHRSWRQLRRVRRPRRKPQAGGRGGEGARERDVGEGAREVPAADLRVLGAGGSIGQHVRVSEQVWDGVRAARGEQRVGRAGVHSGLRAILGTGQLVERE
mmetsp:Transcript_14154/g.34043  ORF Transcript_14154/g.34043 Transcript_14154/m.34043 type:complete len:353 (+) Transcript_14154:413-1471(+)